MKLWSWEEYLEKKSITHSHRVNNFLQKIKFSSSQKVFHFPPTRRRRRRSSDQWNALNTHTSSHSLSPRSSPAPATAVDPHTHSTAQPVSRSIAYISIHNSCGWKLIASIVPTHPTATQFNFQIPLLFYPFPPPARPHSRDPLPCCTRDS